MKKLITSSLYALKARYTNEFINGITKGNMDKFQEFMEQNISVNWLKDKEYSPLWCATIVNEVDMVHSLLKAGANPNLASPRGTSRPLEFALEKLIPTHNAILSGPGRIMGPLQEN